MSKLLIRNGRILDPVRSLDAVHDLWIVDGIITADGQGVPSEDIDAKGMLVMPGLVDVHVHLREPGNEAAETIATGCQAALAGGFTSIVCMPNTAPALDAPERLRDVLRRAAVARGPRVYATGAITIGRQGATLAPLEAMAEAGAVGFTDDGTGVQDARLLREALQRALALNRRLAEHCEVAALVEGGVMHRGEAAARAGLPGIPSEAESEMVARDLKLAEELGAPLHLQHLSAAESVALVRAARARGVRVTAEVTPHHLALTDADAARGGVNFKMNPPLRTERDRQELLRGVADGTLDIIATDHAPHTAEAKAAGFLKAPCGVVGLETALAVIWTCLVLEKVLTPLQMVERMSAAPAAAFGLSGGTLQPGAPGDVTLFDPAPRWEVRPDAFRSRSRNTPFAGQTLQGRVAATIIGGEVRFRELVH